MARLFSILCDFVGFSSDRVSHREKIISGVGGFTGILLILLVTRYFISEDSANLIVASMGASAVLLFAVPHGPLSQPWALLGGHVISAAVGVSCYLLISNLLLAAAAAVGLAIIAMYYLRCIHPPGGATALTAVISGSSVHTLGYQFLITPVLINVVIIFVVAMLFNNLFSWRRYPAAIMRYTRKNKRIDHVLPGDEKLKREDLDLALRQMGQYVDVSYDDLEKIFYLARNRSGTRFSVQQIKLGHYYSNGEYGSSWSVRHIVDESDDVNSGNGDVIYKIVAGKGRRSSGIVSREDFANWARYEVFLNETSWQRVEPELKYDNV